MNESETREDCHAPLAMTTILKGMAVTSVLSVFVAEG